jgi:hypothetical protein
MILFQNFILLGTEGVINPREGEGTGDVFYLPTVSLKKTGV